MVWKDAGNTLIGISMLHIFALPPITAPFHRLWKSFLIPYNDCRISCFFTCMLGKNYSCLSCLSGSKYKGTEAMAELLLTTSMQNQSDQMWNKGLCLYLLACNQGYRDWRKNKNKGEHQGFVLFLPEIGKELFISCTYVLRSPCSWRRHQQWILLDKADETD